MTEPAGCSVVATPDGARARALAAAGLALVLIEPSLAETVSSLGSAGAALLVSSSIAAAALLPRLVGALERRSSAHRADALGLAAVGAVVAIALAIYPRVDVHGVYAGSDRDDALVLGATALMRGDFPYSSLTYLRNPITPLPGALLLAAPFVALGNVALQNAVWVAAFFLVARTELGDPRRALPLLACVLATPGVLHELVTGGDLFANGAYVACALWLLGWLVCRPESSERARVGAAALLGVALSSRFTYVYVIPALLSWLAARVGVTKAVRYVVAAAAAFAAVTVPVYVADPARFSPLHLQEKLDRFAVLLPHPRLAVTIVVALAALAAALWPPQTRAGLLVRCAVVIACPTLLLVALAAVAPSISTSEYLAMGVSFIAPAALGLGALLLAPARASRRDPRM